MNKLLQLQLRQYRAFSAYWSVMLGLSPSVTLKQANNRLEQEYPQLIKIGR